MGGPKALMDVDGRPWWIWQEGSLRHAGMRSRWVVNEMVLAGFESCSVAPRVCEVADGSAPMFVSLLLGVRALGERERFVHVLPVDVPCPSRPTFRALEDAAGEGVAVPTRSGRRGHPVCLSPAWVRRHLLDPTHDRGTRLDELIRGWVTHVETPEDPNTTVNLNTPEDVAAWLESRRLHHD